MATAAERETKIVKDLEFIRENLVCRIKNGLGSKTDLASKQIDPHVCELIALHTGVAGLLLPYLRDD